MATATWSTRLLVGLFVATLFGGCGGGNGSQVNDSPTEEGLMRAARADAEALLEAPASMYNRLSNACRESMTREDFTGQMILGIGMLEGFYGFKLDDLTIGDVKIRDFTLSSADVSVQLLDPDGEELGSDDYSTWIFEEGEWRSTDCESMSGDDDSSAPSDTVGGELRPADEVSEENARADATEGTVGGGAVKVGDIDVTVTSVNFESDVEGDGTGNAFRIAVDVRAENRSTEDLASPELTVRCASGDDGSWYVDSTYTMYDPLPSGTYADGTLMLGVPPDCVEPVIFASDFGSGDAALWPVPASALP